MGDYINILNSLLSFPLRSQIKIDFDAKGKFFQFSIPIFSSKEGLPNSIKEYVDARKNHTFKPHETRYQLDAFQKVILTQQIPFQWGFQPGFRQQVNEFRKMAKHCHKMLSEIAIEEKFKDALNLSE